MRYWFDTEFIDDGKTIDLISIGFYAEDGRTLYLESADCDLSKAGEWVKENVIPKLEKKTHTKASMALIIQKFVGNTKPEFWAYFGAYDWVALCQLYGPMVALPKDWPMYVRDVRQLADFYGIGPMPKQETPEHHALNDAKWTFDAWKHTLLMAR